MGRQDEEGKKKTRGVEKRSIERHIQVEGEPSGMRTKTEMVGMGKKGTDYRLMEK